MCKTVVFGLGSVLMGDEGVGVFVVQDLQRRQAEFGNTEFLDIGVAGFKVLHYLAGKQKAVFVDCAFMGEAPGTIRRFTPREVESKMQDSRFTYHAADLLKIIALSRRLGEAPAEIVLFGIEPEDVAQRDGLTPCLADRLPEYIRQVEKELADA